MVTLPYPGFPTDLQPMAIAMASISDGAALVTENMFEGRFMFLDELLRLGADIRTDGHHAAIRGKERLSGAPVRATDIRAGAGLVLAGLVADGVTTVAEVHHVDRGYQGFVESLVALGADVRREQVDDPLASACRRGSWPGRRRRGRPARASAAPSCVCQRRRDLAGASVQRMPLLCRTSRSISASSRVGAVATGVSRPKSSGSTSRAKRRAETRGAGEKAQRASSDSSATTSSAPMMPSTGS